MIVIEIIGVILLFLGGFVADYSLFSLYFSNDVKFYYGKSKMKKREKGGWKKFLFIDIKDYIISWHYVCFWVFIVTYLPMIVSVILYIFEISWARIIGSILIVIHYIPLLATSLTYWPLYRWNITRSEQKYRKNNPKR